MRFQSPWLLILLLLIPAAAWLRYRSGPRPALVFSRGRLLERLPRSPLVRLQWLPPALFCLACGLLVTALARPQRALQESRVRTEAIDIVLVLDLSTSMLAEDMGTGETGVNRVEAAKEVIEDFIAGRPHDRLGLIAFAGMPYTVAPLTLDHDWLIERLRDLHAGMLEDGTAIGDALASALNRLRDSEAESKVIILLTDGVHNAGTLRPLEAARAAAALEIKVYTVGIGSDGLAPMPVTHPISGRTVYRQVAADLDEATLQEMAAVTEAAYIRAEDIAGMQQIHEGVEELETTEIEVKQYRRYEERYIPLIAGAVLFLVLEQALAATRMGRLPT